MITIQQLKKVFDKHVVALDDFNLTIEDGSFIALLGPSGCGKSTTLNCLAGLLDPSSGSIIFDGEDVTKWAPKDRNIGMVFQSYALYPHLTILDNIAFPLKQKGIAKAERHAQATEVAKKLQIEHLLKRKPSQISGGQQQRVAMCRAIVKQPKYLLLDEPMSNLDARLKIEIREVIKKIQLDLGVTAILVTHDQEEAMALADKIAILDAGRIQQYDTPDMLYEHPANLFVANFMGNPPMNFLRATLDGESLKIGNQSLPCRKGLKEHEKHCDVKVGIRAHQMHISLVEDSDHPLKMMISHVENLGKELLVYGTIESETVRISQTDKSLFNQFLEHMTSGIPVCVSIGKQYQVFLLPDGQNLVDTAGAQA